MMGDEGIKTEIEVDPEISDLIPIFLKAREDDVKKLENLSSEENFDEMARICHTIKGIARPYGFPSLERLAADMEEECKVRNHSRASEILNEMQNYLELYRAS